jgi:hypothetical protein
MKKIFSVSVFCLLAGCGMQNTKPGDGRQWVEVRCSGFANWTQCHEKARRLCPDGYDMAYQEENLVTQKRTMEVACRKEITASGELLPE